MSDAGMSERALEGDVIDDAVLWVKDEAKTQPHWLEVIDPEGWWSAVVKFDGCVDLIRYFNEPRGDEADQLHICDLDDTIRRLEALRDAARAHFGAEWK